MLKWGTNVWQAARDPNLDRYCDLLARGFGQLPFSPETARETADLADRTAPGHAGPSVLRGRAYALSKLWDRAAAELQRARDIDSRSLEDPFTMREWARALAHTGRGLEALAVYRTLGPRLSLLPSADDRARTFLEGAELAFSLGPQGLDDAIAFLGEAKQMGIRDLEWRVGSALALAFDRRGARDEAMGLVTDLARRFRKEAKSSLNAESPEAQAATALVLEAIDTKLALEVWDRYLTAAQGGAPWADHGRQHVDALRKRGAGR
jgi:hypothetical protein